MTEPTPAEIELPNLQTYWTLLERVAESPHLKRAPRLREFLFYVGQRSLKEGCNQVREQEIGVQVFGRPSTYDTNVDNIVRVNATELRKRIDAYFDREGLHETLIMEIPRGSYVPVFHYRRVEAPSAPEPPALSTPAPSHDEIADTVRDAASVSRRPRWMPAGLIAATLAVAVLACGCVYLWLQVRALQRALYPWKDSAAVAALWSEFLDTNRDTDVIMADTSFSMIQNITKQTFSFNDYLSHGYLDQLQAENMSPDMRAVVKMIASKYLVSADVVRLAQRILALDPSGRKFHLYHAREYTPTLLERDNVILIGGRIANPWNDVLENQLNFNVQYDANGFPSITDKKPAPGEQATYSITGSTGYSVAAYLPEPDQSGKTLLIEGTTSESTEAAGDFLLSESQLSSFEKTLHVTKLPYFEVLLKTSQVRGTPISASIVAYRTYPNLH